MVLYTGGLGRARACLLGVVSVLGWCTTPDNIAAQVLDKSKEAWANSNKVTGGFKARWKEDRAISKGYESFTLPVETGDGKVTELPPSDVINPATAVVICDHKLLRYELKAPIWSGSKQKYINREYVSVFDGKDGVVYWPPSVEFPRATITRHKESPDSSNFHIQPLLAAMYPHEYLQTIEQRLADTGQTQTVFGEECSHLFAAPTVAAPGSTDIWVNPRREYGLQKIALGVNGVPFLTIEIDYKFSKALKRWLPSKWMTVHKPRGSSQYQKIIEAVVESIEPLDRLDEKLFSLDFAPGTLVQNAKTNEKYILREGGEKRPILNSERTATYEQLVRTDAGGASPKRARGGFSVYGILTGLVMLSLLAVAFLAFRRMKAVARPR
jgi:hypothetical protein